MKKQRKIVLAYSGGLDTSIILKWLQENYNAEVICYTADIGQEIDKKKIFKNAKKFGVKNIIISDDISMKALKNSIKINTLKAFAAGCNLILHCNANYAEMRVVAENSPLVNNFIIKKTSQFYSFLS